MFEEIRISGLGVIDDATLELGPGFTVLTGETGAGKTMVLEGLGLLLGGRADAALVRSGARSASAEGRLRLPDESPVLARAVEAGAEVDDDGALILARTVLAEGRSRAYVGGRSVPVGLLGELADDLVAVHGQSDQMALLRPEAQRAALDRYAGPAHAALLDRYQAAYRQWREVAADLDERVRRTRERRQEAELLQRGLAEIDAVDPQPGEDDALAAEAHRLANVDALRVAVTSAHEALAADPTSDEVDAGVLLGGARHALDQVDDPELAELARRLGEITGQVADVTADLAAYRDQLDADPERLATVEQRRSALRGLTRTYAGTLPAPTAGSASAGDVDGVLAWSAEARHRLTELDTSEETLAALTAERDRAAAEATELAGKLTASRLKAGRRFAKAVTAELTGLAMPDARLEVAVEERELGSAGADEVTLRLAPHPGAPLRPVHRGASGGELSRVMLAIEVVFADADPVPTMVFDEVDAGVGGQAAIEVGRRLAQLAREHTGNRQVIVVTHLPQVAAYADRHVVVDKNGSRTAVRTLNDAERARELARMLAGLADSELGQAHAEELLAAAANDRS